jgi:hypothetical protein
MKKTAEKPQATTTTIESLDQLQALIDAPLWCEFRLDGQSVRVACKRVTQIVDEQVRELRRTAQPPYKAERKDYDYTDTNYLKARDQNEKTARSLVVYCGCPTVAQKNPGLTDPKAIHTFVRTVLTENIVELICLTIQAGGMELVDRANFTSTSALES